MKIDLNRSLLSHLLTLKQFNIYIDKLLDAKYLIGIIVGLVVSWFDWDLISVFSVFFAPIIIFAGYILFILLFVKAIINMIKLKTIKYITYVILYVLVLLFHLTLSTNSNKLTIDFKLNESRRNNVIKDIKNGYRFPELAHNNRLHKLPLKYWGLSKGGNEIEVEDRYVLFYTFRGIDTYSGFIYSFDGLRPSGSYFNTVREIKHFKDNWWWVRD